MPLAARFAATRVRVADGPMWGNNRHLPGKGRAAKRTDGLVGEWRTSGERKFCLSNLPVCTALRALAAAIKARRVCEQAQQQLEGALGLGHFQGRSWIRLHRHALMSCIAHAYLRHLRLAGPRRTGPGEMRPHVPGPPPSPSLPAVRRAIMGRLFVHLTTPIRCPRCRRRFQPPLDPKMPR